VIVAVLAPSAVTELGLAPTVTNSVPVVVLVNATGVVSSAVCAPDSVAVIVSLCTTLDVSAAVISPFALLVTEMLLPLLTLVALNVLLVPLAASVTAWPATGLPFASSSISSTLLLPPTATLAGLVCSVERLAATAPATNVTATVLLAPPATAVTIFVSAFVDVSAALNCPLAFVFPLALALNVFPLPLALNVTVWLSTAAPLESVTVAVIVAVLVPSAVTLAALVAIATVSAPVVLLTNDTGAVTSAVCAPESVAEIVSACTTLEVTAAARIPLAFVAAVSVLPLVAPGALNVFPLPLPLSVTVWFAIGFPFASASTSSRLLLPPANTLAGLACSDELLALAAPATNVTASSLFATPAAAFTTFVPACVDDSAALNCPFTSVVPLALVPLLCPTVNVFPLPLALNVTVWLSTAAPFESLTVAVIVAVLVPFAVTLAALVVIATASAPVVELRNDTVAVSSAVCAPVNVADTVSLCAVPDVSAASTIPLAFVLTATVLPALAPAALNVLFVPLALSVTPCPTTAFPSLSVSCSKICVLPPTVSVAGLTCSVDALALAAPATYVTATALL